METTASLLRLAKHGDRRALDELYGRYWERILTVVRLRLGPALRSKVDSADIVQDALLSSLRDLDTFEYRSEGDFFHWLCKLVENTIRDRAEYFAAQKRDMTREVPFQKRLPSRTTVFGPLADVQQSQTPSHVAVLREELEQLEQALDRLPELQREAVILVRYEGLSLAEAGQQLDRSADATRMLVARAIVALGKALGGGGKHDG